MVRVGSWTPDEQRVRTEPRCPGPTKRALKPAPEQTWEVSLARGKWWRASNPHLCGRRKGVLRRSLKLPPGIAAMNTLLKDLSFDCSALHQAKHLFQFVAARESGVAW